MSRCQREFPTLIRVTPYVSDKFEFSSPLFCSIESTHTLPASPKALYVTTSSSTGPRGQSGLQERIYVNLCF